jgi:hypothetical protein
VAAVESAGHGPAQAVRPLNSTSVPLASATQNVPVSGAFDKTSIGSKLSKLMGSVVTPNGGGIGGDEGLPYLLTVKSVTYSGDDYFPVVADPGTPDFPSNPPQWLDSNLDGDTNDPGDVHVPIAYVRNSRMTVSATFAANPSLFPTGQAWVRATGPNGLNVPDTLVSVTGSEVTLPATALTQPFGNAVDYYGDYNGFPSTGCSRQMIGPPGTLPGEVPTSCSSPSRSPWGPFTIRSST